MKSFPIKAETYYMDNLILTDYVDDVFKYEVIYTGAPTVERIHDVLFNKGQDGLTFMILDDCGEIMTVVKYSKL